MMSSVGASPRARGSTPERRSALASTSGFPARAGIDPRDRRPPSGRGGLPRARGDRPEGSVLVGEPAEASPRARGSTPSAVSLPISIQGFPARAGIDPLHSLAGELFDGLPRARGDRPFVHDDLPRASRLPRARGDRPRGYKVTAALTRLPRARGDRPSDSGVWSAKTPASPRARGSTPTDPLTQETLDGFPARAGIDPVRFDGAPRCNGLPRARGDRPAL